MIKIIKKGIAPLDEYLIKLKEVTCEDCGCVFTADETEFHRKITGHGESDDVIMCPCCYRLIYSKCGNVRTVYKNYPF